MKLNEILDTIKLVNDVREKYIRASLDIVMAEANEFNNENSRRITIIIQQAEELHKEILSLYSQLQ